MDDSVNASWERFLNPETLKNNLILGSIYITSFEMLKDSVITKLKDFFIDGIDENGFIYSERYKTKVLTLHKNPLQASLIWLQNMEAIDSKDIKKFEKIKVFRNKLAHEMLDFIANIPEDDLFELFNDMISLLTKIGRWWIVNVEIPTNPDYDGQEINENEITPGINITLQLLFDIALGNEEEAKKYYDEFIKKKRTI